MNGSERLFVGSRLRARGLIAFCFLLFHISTVRAGLYDEPLPLEVLNATNFYDVLLGKDNAWIVQFYANWCSHCNEYAPTFKAFANDISGWRRVLGLAVLDCADEATKNVDFCRLYDVKSFPTFHFLWANATREDRGQEVTAHDNIHQLRHQALSLLQGNHSLGYHPTPPSWPTLRPLHVSNVSLAQLWSEVPMQVETLVLVVESPFSLVGQEVTLDVSGNRRCLVLHVEADSPNDTLLQELSNTAGSPNSEASRATIYTVRRGSPAKLLLRVPKGKGSRQQVRDALLPLHAAEEVIQSGREAVSRGNWSLADPSRVYQADLNNALVYALHREVALHKVLNQSQLQVLVNFVDILQQYFPGEPSTMRFLARLQGFLVPFLERDYQLRGEDLSTFLDSGGSANSSLPELGPYVGCLGSRPVLRGYPCSLWMLFHTLTVNAYRASAAPEFSSTSARTALLTVRDYMLHFFTCGECAAHFAIMAEGLELKLREPRDAVLWLWRSHNAVNQRLSGDNSEDPARPKVPFPPASLCALCRTSRHQEDSIDWNVSWNVDRTLQFLLHFYSGDSVVARSAVSPAGSLARPDEDDGASGLSSPDENDGGASQLAPGLWMLPFLLQALFG